MEIEIGSRVIVNNEEAKNEHGTVVEILRGKVSSTEVFEIVLDNGEDLWARAEQIEPEPVVDEIGKEYSLKLDIADNLVIAILYKNDREIGRGHGHIIHSGKLGIAQALSYATKRIWQELGGGKKDE